MYSWQGFSCVFTEWWDVVVTANIVLQYCTTENISWNTVSGIVVPSAALKNKWKRRLMMLWLLDGPPQACFCIYRWELTERCTLSPSVLRYQHLFSNCGWESHLISLVHGAETGPCWMTSGTTVIPHLVKTFKWMILFQHHYVLFQQWKLSRASVSIRFSCLISLYLAPLVLLF